MLAMCPRPDMVPSDAEDDDPAPLVGPTRKEKREEQRAAMLAAGGTVCSKSKCARVVTFDDTHKTCELCRARDKRNNKSDKGRARAKRNNKSDKGRARAKRHNKSDKGKAAQQRYKQGKPKTKMAQKRAERAVMLAAGGKVCSHSNCPRVVAFGDAHKLCENCRDCAKRHNQKLSRKLGASLRQILTGKHDFTEPMTLKTYGIDRTEAEWQAHFASQFEPWMDWPNHGKHKKGAPPKSKWNVGHKIAQSRYDHSDPDEVRKCWSLANLFPQCAKENVEQNNRYLPSFETLLAMRAEWPKAWNGVLPDWAVALPDPDASDDSDASEDSDDSDDDSDESDESDCADCAD